MAYEDEDHLADELVGSALSAVPVAGPLLAPLGERLSRKVRASHARRTSKAVAAAERRSGLGRDELRDAIADDPRLVPLLTRVLFAAGMNGYDEIIEVMGGALGDAVRSRERLDEAELVLAALTDLGPSHVEMLRVVAALTAPRQGDHDRRRPRPDAIVEQSSLPERLARLSLAQLEPAGLITRSGGLGGGDFCDMTELGHLLLEVIDEYSAE